MPCVPLLIVPSHLGAAADPYANAPAYMRPLSPRARVRPLVTVGEQLPLTDGAGGTKYRFVGRPDGLGLYGIGPEQPQKSTWWRRKPRSSQVILLVNHELRSEEGGPVGPLPRGARVSEIVLEWRHPRYITPPLSVERLVPVSARCAIERVFAGDEPQPVDPVTRGFAKFCSAFLADDAVGFDRPILLLGEEARSPKTFDERGGQAWAIFEGAAYALPRLGRAEWENIVAAPGTGSTTVLFGLEDASGTGLDSQLYMYLGEKQPDATDPLARNGLRGGQLHVLCADDSARGSEAGLHRRGASTPVHWTPLEWDLSDVELDHAAKHAGAFGFVRIEDGACDPRQPGVLYFVSTGVAGTVNPRGRLYRLRFDPRAPTSGATLEILLDGGEGVVHPDNIDVNRDGQIAIQEDPGSALRDLKLQRDSSIWIYDTRDSSLVRIATMDREAARRHALAADRGNRVESSEDAPGEWESSGIVDASAFLGGGAWICTVQAPSLRIAPVDETVNGGQVLEIIYK